MLAPFYPATHSQWLQKGRKLGEWKHPEKLKHDAFVVFQIKQATSMCVCLRFRLASCLAPFSSSPPCVAAGRHAGWVNRKKKGAKEPAGQRILVDEPHNVSSVPRSRVCGSCEHYFALPFVPYRLLHPFTGEGPEGQATCGTRGARRPLQEGWLLEIQKGVLCVLRVFIRSLFRCLWRCLWLCATRFARSGRFARFVQLPPLLPLGLPPCVLHVLHFLHIPRDRLWTWIQDDATTESSDEEESEEDSEEEAEEAEEEDEMEEEGSAGLCIAT